MSDPQRPVNFKAAIRDPSRSAFARYRELCYGRMSLGAMIRAELLLALLGSLPGAVGIFLRGVLYRSVFGSVSGRPLIGCHVTLRHPHKIRLGAHVLLDDHVVLDAKGETNDGIRLGDNVFISRNCILSCKNGDIHLERNVGLSAHSLLVSANRITIGEGTVIGAYTYLLSIGDYDYRRRDLPFFEQTPLPSRGPLTIGRNCWIGTRVTILDGACIGDHCVIGAHSLVTQPIPSHSLAYGTPARVVRAL